MEDNSLYLVNIDGDGGEIERLRIQTIPLELGVDISLKYGPIASIGRNNPFYHYTGAEDSVSFTLDWYSNEENREDVIRSCRWIESLARNDGYLKGPARIVLLWGDLFKYSTWIITDCSYRLSLFNREYGFLPQQAYQNLTLTRVIDHNSTLEERRNPNWY